MKDGNGAGEKSGARGDGGRAPAVRTIENERFGEERALYGTKNARIVHCRVEGEEDGESFLKESENVAVEGVRFDLRYPMWHCKNLTVTGAEMTENCRAALWYGENVAIEKSRLRGIKALRECRGASIEETAVDSPEFGWRCDGVRAARSTFHGDYAFLMSRNIEADSIELGGKYSFQYVENAHIVSSALRTKDAFWHAKNAVIEDTLLEGEYLGWYSDGLTLIRCRIAGTQPLCYCKNLRLVDCTMTGCDLAFEYSEVDANILSFVDSVKNPLRGKIVADGYGEIITNNAKYPVRAEIVTRGKK